MHHVKPPLYPHSMTETLNDLMHISIDGPGICKFKLSLHTEHWQSVIKRQMDIGKHSSQFCNVQSST